MQGRGAPPRPRTPFARPKQPACLHHADSLLRRPCIVPPPPPRFGRSRRHPGRPAPLCFCSFPFEQPARAPFSPPADSPTTRTGDRRVDTPTVERESARRRTRSERRGNGDGRAPRKGLHPLLPCPVVPTRLVVAIACGDGRGNRVAGKHGKGASARAPTRSPFPVVDAPALLPPAAPLPRPGLPAPPPSPRGGSNGAGQPGPRPLPFPFSPSPHPAGRVVAPRDAAGASEMDDEPLIGFVRRRNKRRVGGEVEGAAVGTAHRAERGRARARGLSMKKAEERAGCVHTRHRAPRDGTMR